MYTNMMFCSKPTVLSFSFFFSSRRRHTRSLCDWSSDVCSSDLFFRGMLDVRARRVNDEMKLAAAHALAAIVSKAELSEEYITPSMFDGRVVPPVAAAVADAATRTGVARRRPRGSAAAVPAPREPVWAT